MATATKQTKDTGTWCVSSYDRSRERTWHLSLVIGTGVHAWAAHGINDGSIAALGWSEDDRSLDTDEVPTHPASISFITLPEWSTLVPDGALEAGSQARHLSLVHGGLPTGALRDEVIASLGATCIYVHDDEAERKVLDRFPNARPVPMQSLLVRSAMVRATQRTTMVLHRSHQNVEICIAAPGRVLLSNSFPARTSQDLLYFALLAAEGSGIKAAELQLVHGGTHLTDHERELLGRYFANEDGQVGNWAERPLREEVDGSRWLALVEQFACVS